MAYQPIENYGIIGNMRTVVLVGIHGSIDWYCYPHFDSPSVFGALMDNRKGGRFSIQPDEGIWEVRKQPEHFVYSKVMNWVALDRGIGLAEKRSFPSLISAAFNLDRTLGNRPYIQSRATFFARTKTIGRN
jgi:GH15 family glucan-1,4-alpha-glucosidase